MTDKQIIDNDFWRKKYGDMHIRLSNKAIELEAQLSRKEQECEELYKWLPIVTRLEEQFKSHEKAKGLSYKTYAEQVFAELDQLKAENDELKQFLSKEPLAIQALQQAYSDYKKRSDIFYEDNIKLKQALTEIKEITEFSDRPYIHCGEYNDCCEIIAEILSKISEVLDE